MNSQWKKIWEIFLSFLKIGPFTFGGGYAMIPLIEREVVTRKGWVKEQEVNDVFAVAQSIPGAIAINSATFIGFRIAGLSGALAALIGVMLPTFLIVIGLSIFFLYFNSNPKIEAAFEGIRPAIVAIIAFAGFKIGKMSIIDKTTWATVCATIVILLFLPIHPVFVILGGAIIGIILVKIKLKLGYEMKWDEAEDMVNQNPDYYLGAGI